MNKLSRIKTSSVPVRNKKRTRYLALALCLVMLVALLGSSRPFSTHTNVHNAATAQDIADAKKKKEDAKAQIDEVQTKVDSLKDEKNGLESDLDNLNQLSVEQKAQYETIAAELEAALTAKQDALDEFLTSQDTLQTKKTQYSERMSTMFEYQNRSLFEIVLESDSVAGFFTNLEIISLVGEADQQALDELQAAMDDAELKSAYAQQQATDMQAVADQKQAELDALEAQIGKTTDALDEKKTELSEWEQKEDDLNAKASELDSVIASLQKELAKQQSGTTVAPPQGSMTWPYPGDSTVYSGFGMRMHPIYHVMKMHTGVDLGGAYGNPIVAAADGTVIKVDTPVPGKNKGGTNYGNYIVIDNGGGISTLYAHCKDVYVAVGDTVTAGQKIAACGSTGTSTGAHLHFEVRVNGSPVNPVPYIT